jgi:hypothetical protein
MRRLGLVGVALLFLACPGGPGPDGGTGGGRGGGSGGGTGGGGFEPFEVIELDPAARDATYLAMAADPAQRRIGVAYFTPRGTETMMGTPDFDIKYVEWQDGAIVVPPETIRFVQRKVGIALAFHPTTGEPVVSYLGGDPGFVMGSSIFWFQSDAVISRRAANGTWTETVVNTDGDTITCGNRVSDIGYLVGLWPALTYDSTGKLYLGYRDGHNGQFPQQDWAGSDVEVWDGSPVPSNGVCVQEGGNNKLAWGGHLKMVLAADDQPAIVYDQMFGTADTNGQNVAFQKRNASGTWTPVATILNIANTQTGASLAWDPMEGYGIAVVDRATNELSYVRSADGVTWTAPDPVFGSGSGGWYPSLAMDPKNHEPAIAFYICSAKSGLNEQGCTTTDDELRIRQRIAGTWRDVVVDPNGGYEPKIGFFPATQAGAEPKRFVVYRQPPSIDPTTGLTVTNVGALKLAVER